MSPRSLSPLALGLALAGLAVGAAAHADGLFRADQTPGDAAAVALGQSQYLMCAACHGQDGEGKVGIAPRLNSTNYLAIASNAFLRDTIVKGRAGTNMAPFGAGMSPEAVDGLVAYIRSWQTTPGLVLDEGPLTGDVATGEQLYKDICARCHGRSGAGYSESGSGTGIGRAGFLDVASDGFLRAVILEGKDNTAMRAFDTRSPVAVADLERSEVDAIIRYLRANAW